MCQINTFTIIFLFFVNYTFGNSINYADFLEEFNLKRIRLSTKCQVHFLAALKNKALMRMFDASTKIPEGVLNGRFIHLGAYDECLNTHYVVKALSYNRTYNARYCLTTIPPLMRTAVCFPSGCTIDETAELSTHLKSSKFFKSYCYEKSDTINFTTSDIITMTFFGCILAIVLLSTITDIYLQSRKRATPNFMSVLSAYTNGKQLLKSQTLDTNVNQLLCLNGIKSISMMWVIFGHQYFVLNYAAPLNNLFTIVDWTKRTSSMIVFAATVSVDTFLAVGGLLTVYTFLKSQENNKNFNVFYYYIHRYLRLTPALGVVILFHVTLAQYVGDGPLWGVVEDNLAIPCRKNWWSSLLYIQNYVSNIEDACLGHSWYLSIDMQLFILSPLVLIIMKQRPVIAISILMTLSIVGMIVPFCLGMVHNLQAIPSLDELEMLKTFNIYYGQTYGRFAPYTIGMIFGYVVYKMKTNQMHFKLNLHEILALWGITVIGLVSCVFAGHSLITSEYQQFPNSLHLAFNRPAWAFCVCLCITLCSANYGGFVNTFLSLPIFQFLAKLSYSMYLTHYGIVIMMYASQRVAVNFSNFEMMTRFWGTFMLTLVVSVVLCLVFESPMIALEKWILCGLRRRNTPKTTPAQF